MKHFITPSAVLIISLLFGKPACSDITAQESPLKTPLSQQTLKILSNEISGQFIFNNMVAVTGAPWIRSEEEFSDTFYETSRMYQLVRSYGIENVRIERAESDHDFDYPVEAELWITSPDPRLLARLGADAALVARGSQSADITGDLIYIPPLSEEEQAEMLRPENRVKYEGKVALMWTHARSPLAEILDSVGVQAVISFSSRERYVDPNMVVYSSGSYDRGENLKCGFTLSWRQWSELLEDVEYGDAITVRCKTVIEKKGDKFESLFSWIEGTEPDKPGVIFTAHLFEGYTKRGANDNTGGCVVQLEILRSLTKLISEGAIEQPRRNIYFLWPNEISGTYRFITDNPDIISGSCININMDMVSEGLRLNNSWLTMSETPDFLASFYDGLANSVLNYVWRTNDIVYLGDSPRGRRGGQYFPDPMIEKNGSVDAFRYFIHEATGGSDHLCFNNSSVAVPGVEFFTWPDYWYHADTDTPDKGDPTQMKRIAFIGAATAYATANCNDDVVNGMVDVTSGYGYKRVAERGLSRAVGLINLSDKSNLQENTLQAGKIITAATSREIAALESIRSIYTGSPHSLAVLNRSLEQWNDYRSALQAHISEVARAKAKSIGSPVPQIVKKSTLTKKMDGIVPSVSDDIMYKVFTPSGFEPYNEYLRLDPGTPASKIASGRDSRTLVNYINGSRSLSEIITLTEVATGKIMDSEDVYQYFVMLRETGFITF